MTPEEVESRLRQSAAGRQARTPGCPDDHLIAGFADGGLGEEAQGQIEAHLADCAACASLVGNLSRQLRNVAAEGVPDMTLARARRLGAGGTGGWMPRLPQLAAAVLAVVCVSALIHFIQVDSPAITPSDQAAPRTTRSMSGIGAPLQVLSPTAGATLDPGSLDVRWTRVPAAQYYEVRIVTDTGVIVSEHRVSTTGWRPREGLQLEPGTDYYVRVDAFVPGARSVSSEHVPFRTIGRE